MSEKNYYIEASKLSNLIVHQKYDEAIKFIQDDPVVIRCRGACWIGCSGSWEIKMWLYPGMVYKENPVLFSTDEFKDFVRFIIDTMASFMPEKDKDEFVAYGLFKYALLTGWREFAEDAVKISPLCDEAKEGLKDEFGSENLHVTEWGMEDYYN